MIRSGRTIPGGHGRGIPRWSGCPAITAGEIRARRFGELLMACPTRPTVGVIPAGEFRGGCWPESAGGGSCRWARSAELNQITDPMLAAGLDCLFPSVRRAR